MKISVIGINPEELESGKSLAEMGNEVVYVCKDYEHVNNIKKGYYTNTEKEILKNIKEKDVIDFTSDFKEALEGANMCFIAEGEKGNDSSALFKILANAKEVGANMSNHTFVVDRSSLPISRAQQIKETIQEELNKRASNLTFEVISDHRFLRA
jgi:UDPglucose 6-dehydrogenase